MGKNLTSPPTPSNSNDSSPISLSLHHSTIRGFKLGENSTYYKGLPLAAQGESAKKKCATFTIRTALGGEESPRRPNSNLSASRSKKKTSFKDEVAVGRAATHNPVFESDDEDEDVSESAIEDEDDSWDWEDSDYESGPSSVNGKELFERVDSRPNLTSQRSLLTTLTHELDRAKALLANAAFRSTPHIRRPGRGTPNGPSVATSPEPNAQLPTSETATRARPIIMTTSNTHPTQPSLSPRTTRHNMLSTELTKSLRESLLWERQHRSTTNLATLKRRHTSNDVKNLWQHPEPALVLSDNGDKQRFNNYYFHVGLNDYDTKGW